MLLPPSEVDLNLPDLYRRVSRRAWLFLALPLLLTRAPRIESQSPAPLALQYHLRLQRPTTHLMEVEVVVSKPEEAAIDFVMPAWSPGRYAIYDFAKNVQEFEAAGAQGQALPWTKLDKQTWRVEAREAGGTVRVRYRVYANDLSGTFSQFDTSHANVNGASVFMYVGGHKQDSLALTVEAPAAWKLISGFSESTEQRAFRVANYDLLVDTPMEISGECSLDEFRERGKVFRIAVHSYAGNDGSRAELAQGLKKIVRSEMAVMPEPDFQHYTFIFHFAPDISTGDGMEHLNSTQIVIRGGLDGASLPQALEDAAHEFFHLWNVKRLRPAGLGPFDYTRESYTRTLWFAEGVTSYCAFHHLLRSRVWSRQEFLRQMAEEIGKFEAQPGRALMSAESSSFHAWFYDRAPQMQQTNFSNTTISYYNQGALLGLLLDLEIRSRTQGRKSLEDVLVSMYRKFYQADGTSYYGPGRGYEARDILESINGVTGSDFSPFFDRYVRGTEALPYDRTLALAGLRVHVRAAADSPPSLGVLTERRERGLKITSVRPGGPADRAGLSRDDLLIAVDDLALGTAELKDRLKMYPPGAEVPFTVERHGRQERITVTLGPPAADQFSIEEATGATPAHLSLRDAWLGSSH